MVYLWFFSMGHRKGNWFARLKQVGYPNDSSTTLAKQNTGRGVMAIPL
jgi:hypothetical protein